MTEHGDAAAPGGHPDRLTRFLGGAGEAADVVGWRPLSGGRSAETILITLRDPAGDRQCVLHLEPDDGPLAGIASVATQFDLLGAAERAGIAAPRALWLCTDAAVLGRPFIVTDFVPGAVPSPWRAEGRRFLEEHPPGGPLAREFVETLVRIHALGAEEIPVAARGGDPAAAQSFAEHERRRWASVVARSSAFADDPVLAYAEGWLAACRPAVSATPGLVHGDYRVGNLVIEGERIASVLDWELAEAGDTVYDLGVICSPPLRTGGLASGLWEPEALVSYYEQVSGRAVDRDVLAYYSVLATFKITSLWVNASRAFSDGAEDLGSLRAGYSALQTRVMLAEVLRLETPPGVGGTDQAARAAAAMLRALREDVLPSVEADAGDVLRSVLAVLRAEAASASPAELEGFSRAVHALDSSTRERASGTARPPGGATPNKQLAHVARRLMADPVIAADETHPLHERLRALVGRAAAPEFGTWPC